MNFCIYCNKDYKNLDLHIHKDNHKKNLIKHYFPYTNPDNINKNIIKKFFNKKKTQNKNKNNHNFEVNILQKNIK